MHPAAVYRDNGYIRRGLVIFWSIAGLLRPRIPASNYCPAANAINFITNSSTP